MTPVRKRPLTRLFAGVLLGLALTGTARASFDPTRLPAVTGRVAQYSLTPRGDVDGVILQDGTEVLLPPHLGPALVQVAKPGDAVTAHGLRARIVPMMQAASLTNDITGRTVGEASPGASAPDLPRERPRAATAAGRVKALLHGMRGELNGALLEDGTILRLPPPETARLLGSLQPGAEVTAIGEGSSGPLGRVLAVERLQVR